MSLSTGAMEVDLIQWFGLFFGISTCAIYVYNWLYHGFPFPPVTGLISQVTIFWCCYKKTLDDEYIKTFSFPRGSYTHWLQFEEIVHQPWCRGPGAFIFADICLRTSNRFRCFIIIFAQPLVALRVVSFWWSFELSYDLHGHIETSFI